MYLNGNICIYKFARFFKNIVALKYINKLEYIKLRKILYFYIAPTADKAISHQTNINLSQIKNYANCNKKSKHEI